MLLRKLGDVEQSLEQASRETLTGNIVTYSRIRGPLEIRLLAESLSICCRQHPLLGARIVEQGKQLYFATQEIPAIALEVVQLQRGETWEDTFQDVLNRPLPSCDRLVQFVLLCTCDPELHYLFITTHHAISDGLSCGYLHAEIVANCHALLHGYSQPKEDIIRPVLPPVEHLLPAEFSGLPGKLKGLRFLGKLLGNQRRVKPEYLPVETCVPVENRRTRLIHRTLSVKATQALLQRCQDEGVTSNAAMMAALLMAVSRSVQRSRPNQPVKLSTKMAVNLRRYLVVPEAFASVFGDTKIQDKELAALFSILLHSYTVDPQIILWDLAREIKGKIRNNIRNKDILNHFLCMRLLGALALRSPNKPHISVTLSDVGKVMFAFRHGEFEIERYGGTLSANLEVGTITAIVNQFQDRLTINFVFSEPSLNGSLAQQIVDDAIAQITLFEPAKMLPEINCPNLKSLEAEALQR